MSLYQKWTNMVTEFVKTKGEKAFWDKYSEIETEIYKDILNSKQFNISSTFTELAEKYKTTLEFIVGFIDGVNESLDDPVNVDELSEDSHINISINKEKLYYNMLEAKADYLYNLNEWDDVLSNEERQNILKSWRQQKSAPKNNKIGRNEKCTCGSGKKYKKCCGS